MIFFKRKQPKQPNQPPAEIPEECTRLGKTIAINGTISGQDDMAIEGTFEGDIDIQGEVAIKQEAFLKGRINGNRVLIAGSVEGQFLASHKMNIMPTARVKGEISAPLVSLDAGAILNGKVTMASNPKRRQRAK